jgi:hypothetical protein
MATSCFDGWLYIHQKHQVDLFKNFLLEEICVKFAMLVNYITWWIEWIDYDSKREEPKTIV